jgi:hypothetical protein
MSPRHQRPTAGPGGGRRRVGGERVRRLRLAGHSAPAGVSAP